MVAPSTGEIVLIPPPSQNRRQGFHIPPPPEMPSCVWLAVLQVLVCTSTLAWGVNFPAHLVVVKGTEFFDGKTHRYKDFPITDLLQVLYHRGWMFGRGDIGSFSP